MKQLLIISFVLSISLITGCGKSASTDTVESLVVNPERLKELRASARLTMPRWGMPSALRCPRPRGGASWGMASRLT